MFWGYGSPMEMEILFNQNGGLQTGTIRFPLDIGETRFEGIRNDVHTTE